MTDQPEKLNLASVDIADERRREILSLFPEARTEGGKLDFERLKLALGDSVDVGKERYGMNWPGKADCFKTIQRSSLGTLRPAPEESVNFDTTENLIIEGDNLEALKLLQKSYLGKVKMIYIDPPYNTGNDFIYPDNFSENLQTYLEYTGQVDSEGKKFSTNTEADGRFHSKWLNMMYPRLYLARNLLRSDGVIFISIDDGEFDNLRKLCNEIFGEENFVGCIVWHKKYAPANDTVDLSASHDFILVFAKSRPVSNGGRVDALLSKLSRTDEQNRVYKNPDGDPRGPWRADNYTCNKSAEERPNLYYAITNPNTGEEIWPSKTRVWGYGKDVHLQHVIDNRIWWGLDGSNKVPAYKRFLSEVGGIIADTWWDWRDVGHNDEAKKEFLELLPELSRSFETPKPTRLIRRMVQLATQVDAGDIVLDFFAGSGSTGDAVLMLNEHDGGDRRFVLVQLPEPTDRANFGTIADITKQRVRRVIERLTGKEGGRSNTGDERSLDRGFRVFKLAESNFKPWDAESPKDVATLTTQLGLHVDHIRDGRTAQDLLFEVLLKTGFPLTTPVEDLVLADKTVHSVAGGALLVCLDRQLTVELVRAIADKKPERVVCLDAGFAGNDQLKANAAQIFRSEGITSFKTV